jgi:hypothetical protein
VCFRNLGEGMSDEQLQAIIAEAIAVDAEARRAFEQPVPHLQTVRGIQLKRRDFGELIYKVKEDGLVGPVELQPLEPSPAPHFTPTQHNAIGTALGMLRAGLRTEIWEALEVLTDEAATACGKLERRIVQLEAEVRALREIKAKRGRSAAQ